MSEQINQILADLKESYNVGVDYYPNISLETDIERGLLGEVEKITKQLENNGFVVSSTNVFGVMKIKKNLLEKYYKNDDSENLEKYRKFILEEMRPIGTLLSTEYLFVYGIISVILYVGTRFLGSFADESGKIAAKKLLNDKEETAAKVNLNVNEYNIIAREVNILIQDGGINNSIEKLDKSIKQE